MENETLRFWADISTVYLLTIVFIFGLIPAVIGYFAIRGMMVVNRKAQPYMKLASYYTGIARGQVDKYTCLLYTSPSPRDRTRSRMPSSA